MILGDRVQWRHSTTYHHDPKFKVTNYILVQISRNHLWVILF